MSKKVTPENIKLEFATWTDKDIDKLTLLINKSFNEINYKFVNQIKDVPEFQHVNLSNITKDKKVYSAFEQKRDEHISYFKKYPKYVREKLEEQLEISKKTGKFDAQKIAESALPVALAQKKVQNKLKQGTQKAIDAAMGMARRHANFIARDQMGKFSSAINHAHAQNIGAKRFVWRTMEDSRVRPEHAERDGKTYNYSNPPDGELPGDPVRCRCIAETIINI